MSTYKLKPEGFKKVRKRMLTSLPFLLFAACTGIYIAYATGEEEASFSSFYFSIPIILVLLSYSILKAIKQQKKKWLSYELTIDGNVISLSHGGTTTLSLYKRDIIEIEEVGDGNLNLKTASKREFINIPWAVEKRQELLVELADLGPISKQTRPHRKLVFAAMIITPLVFLAFAISTNRFIITMTGGTLALALLWSFYEIQRNKGIDAKMKKASYIIVLPLFAIVMRILMEFGIQLF